MTLVRPSSVSQPQPRAQRRSITLWMVAACSALPAVATAQTSADIISAVETSRANIARLELAPPTPFVCAPPAAVQCATPFPKGEFETTAAFTARLAAAEQACNEGRRQAEQTCRNSALARDAEIKKDEQARAAIREQRMVLPVWNATALYDADREAFLVAISDARGIVTLGKSLDDAFRATATDLAGNISRVCVVKVLPRDAPHWRARTNLFLEFRLDAMSPPRISDAALVSGTLSNEPMTRTRLAGCLGAMPPAICGVSQSDRKSNGASGSRKSGTRCGGCYRSEASRGVCLSRQSSWVLAACCTSGGEARIHCGRNAGKDSRQCMAGMYSRH